jgi:hypothetical protein
MDVPESNISTSSAASEMMNSKDDSDKIAGDLESNTGVQSPDIEPEKEEKKSSKFKLTVFMLCLISVVVAMASRLFPRVHWAPFQVRIQFLQSILILDLNIRTPSSWLRHCQRLQLLSKGRAYRHSGLGYHIFWHKPLVFLILLSQSNLIAYVL